MNEKPTDNDVIRPPAPPEDPPRTGGEHDILMSFIDYFRTVLTRKCAGLSAEQLQVTAADSSLTLGRLMRHMAFVEDHWFRFVLLGDELPAPWTSADWNAQPDWEMDTASEFSPAELGRQLDDAIARSRAATAGLGLDHLAAPSGTPRTDESPVDPDPHDRGVRPALRSRRLHP